MTHTGKDNFINRISDCLGRNTIPGAPTSLHLPNDVQNDFMKGASMDELKKVFIQNAGEMGTAVYECKPSNLNDTIVKAVSGFPKGPILITDDSFWTESGTVEALKKTYDTVDIWDVGATREKNISRAEKAAVGIALANLALAETATVLLFSHPGSGRSVTLLPMTTVYVIHEADIRSRLTQGMAFIQEHVEGGLPSSINFVSGASSTADIELVRVQGVHGPVEIAYIIVGSV